MNIEKKSMITPYTALNTILLELLKGLILIFSNKLYGFYLQGSFATGGYDEHSDVDFIVVYNSNISTEEIDRLQILHKNIYKMESHWAQHLEGTYFDLQTITVYPKVQDKFWYLDNGSQELIKSAHCNTLVVRWVLREKGIIMYGPDPNTFIDSIKVRDLRQEILYDMVNWGKEIIGEPKRFNNKFYQTFIVLNYCRMYHDMVMGTINSKQIGAIWAKKNLESKWHDLIDRAWLGRPLPEQSVRERANQDDFAKTIKLMKLITEKSKKWIAKKYPALI